MSEYGPRTEAADALHAMKYRTVGEDFRESMNRVAFGLKDNDSHYHEFRQILLHQRFCPGGRIQGAIGASKEVTAYNCFVSGTIADSFVTGQGCIMDRAKEAAATMQWAAASAMTLALSGHAMILSRSFRAIARVQFRSCTSSTPRVSLPLAQVIDAGRRWPCFAWIIPMSKNSSGPSRMPLRSGLQQPRRNG